MERQIIERTNGLDALYPDYWKEFLMWVFKIFVLSWALYLLWDSVGMSYHGVIKYSTFGVINSTNGIVFYFYVMLFFNFAVSYVLWGVAHLFSGRPMKELSDWGINLLAAIIASLTLVIC